MPIDDSLDLAAAAGRLVQIFRQAEANGSLRGRPAAEVDGDVANLEESIQAPDDVAAITEASRWLIKSAAPFEADLPETIRAGLRALSARL